MAEQHVEKSDARFSMMALTVGALLLMLVGGVMFVKVVYHRDFNQERARTQAAESKRFPQPQPGHFTAESLRELRAQESRTLESYGWSDKTQTAAHVPIERAIEIYEAHHAR